MSYEHCEKHNIDATNGCAFCEAEKNLKKWDAPQMLGEVVNSAGKPTGIRRADALSMLDFLARIENSAEIMKFGGPSHDPWIAIGLFLDLFDSPRNVAELWIWNRYRWAFGRARDSDGRPKNESDTWLANDTLDTLLKCLVELKQLTAMWGDSQATEKDREALDERIDKSNLAMMVILARVLDNSVNWPDLASFNQWKG